jgi:hypothetical protein
MLLEVSMSSLQERLAAVTEMQLATIAAAAHLKSRLSELEELRERVMKALEIAPPEMVRRRLPSAGIEGGNAGHS